MIIQLQIWTVLVKSSLSKSLRVKYILSLQTQNSIMEEKSVTATPTFHWREYVELKKNHGCRCHDSEHNMTRFHLLKTIQKYFIV